jgi:hypothetical protein
MDNFASRSSPQKVNFRTDSYRAGKSVEVEEPEVKEGETT